jgi:uncharacterized caspase-like protein
MTAYRDVTEPYGARVRAAPSGRSYIAVIGIDRYRTWSRLDNAVSDARGAMDLFLHLGFELTSPPLFDDRATGAALHRLVTSDLTRLRKQDSLVVFFAGHGHTVTRSFFGGASVKDGYLIPVDGGAPDRSTCTWIRLDSWLKDITRLPAQHILVILDACHSGLALGSILQSRIRGLAPPAIDPMDKLRARRSRRIITSALEDQVAMDRGPVPGHSLFTGCLIEALTHGLRSATDATLVTGSEIGLYVQRRVSGYENSSQTPDFGTLELDDRGELVIRLPRDPSLSPSGISPQALGTDTPPDPRLLLPDEPRRIIDVAPVPAPASAVSAPAAASDAPASSPAQELPPAIDLRQLSGLLRVAHRAPRPRTTAAKLARGSTLLLRPLPKSVSRIVALTGVLCLLAITAGLFAVALDPSDDDSLVLASSELPGPHAADGVAHRADEATPPIEAIASVSPAGPATRSLVPAASTGPTDVVQVSLFCDNGLPFSVYENDIKLFDGPGRLEVPTGQHRIVVIKMRGFHDRTLVVDDSAKKVLFHVRPIHPLRGA